MSLAEAPNLRTLERPERLIYPLFALSGIAGLIYEGTWARYLKLFLGHSSYGQILTLCIYMGGLGIGSFISARLLSKIKRPLRAYALTEFAIGVGGILYHPLYVYMTERFYNSTWSAQLGSSGAEAVKVVLAVFSTVPVAILLGMTFPLIAAELMRRHKDSGRVSVPLLYFANSGGAAFGLLFASYLLIPFLGTHGTLLLAASLNMALAFSFWWIDRRLVHTSVAEPVIPAQIEQREAPEKEFERAMPNPRVWLWVALATGLTSFVYEVVWIRLLSLMMGSSTHSFDQMVSAFILGLALGSLVSKRLLKRDALVMLALAQMLMGFFALSTIYTHTLFFDLMNASNLLFRPSETGYVGWNILKYLVAMTWMIPTSFFAGMTLPFLTFIISKATRSETPVGRVYGFNTMGAILGSVLGGLFLIPILQLKWSLVSAAVADMLIGVVLLMVYRKEWRTQPLLWGILVAVVFPAFLLDFDEHMVTAGVFRSHKDYLRYEKVWVRNGKTATISFHESPVHKYIKTNGKPDASIRKDRTKPIEGDELTQAAVAFIPMATRKAPYEAGMVGFGSGMAAYYMLADPMLTRLDVVEIESEMLNLAQKFRPINARAFDDPRVHLYVDDARTFFHTHGRKYDELVSVPSNPWVSGVSSLFSEEFYHHMRRYLKPGGTLVQWLQLYEFDNTLMLNILKALHQSFAHVVLYRIPDEPDIVVLASDSIIRQDYIQRFATTDSISTEFGRMHRPWYYFGEQNFLATTQSLTHLMDGVPANSEFVPWVDNRAEMVRYAMGEVGVTSGFDSCGICWPALLDPKDYAPRKAFKDWLQSTRAPDTYLQENIRHQLLLLAAHASFPDTVNLGSATEDTASQVESKPLQVLTPLTDQAVQANISEKMTSSIINAMHYKDDDATWRHVWSDLKILIQQVPYSPARDSLPEFALMRRMVNAQLVPLEVSVQFEFDDHMAHKRYKEAVRMLPAFREIFVLGTMDAQLLRQLALAAFLSNDTREFRSIFQNSILLSLNMDNSEKRLIAILLGLSPDVVPLNSAVEYD